MKRGCFGHIVTYNPNIALCAGCEDAKACGESVSERIQKLRSLGRYPTLDEQLPTLKTHLGESHAEEEVRELHPPAVNPPMNKKAHEYANNLRSKGVDLRAGLMGVFNPIPERPAFLKIAFQLLLDHGRIDKTELKECYMRTLGWKEQTASSHVGIVASLFAGVGVASDGGKELIRYVI